MAVGTTIKGRALDGSRHNILVEDRPTECALCCANLKDIALAMHPLYDDHGTKGRQIILMDDHGSPRAAWCHTLCALCVCSYSRTAGCVYGCTASGTYSGEDDVEIENDDRSVNSALARALEQIPDEDDVGIHHFVVVLPTWRGENSWTKIIDASKVYLRCYICRKKDNQVGTLRFPVQCSANESNNDAVKGIHRSKGVCTEAMHVGCAMWWRNSAGEWPAYRQVYFFPGSDERSPLVDLYCWSHAKDLSNCQDASKIGATILRFPTACSKFPKRKKPRETIELSNKTIGNVSPCESTVFEPSKKLVRKSLLVTCKESSSAKGGVFVNIGSPISGLAEKDWSCLFVGQQYQPELLDDLLKWDSIEPVHRNDVFDDSI